MKQETNISLMRYKQTQGHSIWFTWVFKRQHIFCFCLFKHVLSDTQATRVSFILSLCKEGVAWCSGGCRLYARQSYRIQGPETRNIHRNVELEDNWSGSERQRPWLTCGNMRILSRWKRGEKESLGYPPSESKLECVISHIRQTHGVMNTPSPHSMSHSS